MTFSPGDNQLYTRRSDFFDHCAQQVWVSTYQSAATTSTKRAASPRQQTPRVTFSFSELKYLFECPYQFKLRFLYGFNPPLHEALGFGKGLHDTLAEVHKRAVAGDVVGPDSAAELVDRHLYTPFAYPELRETLTKSAVKAIERYFATHGDELPRTVHSEKQIQVHVAPGIIVDGRIDLIRKLATDELAIVDFKSSERSQEADITRAQLHTYAVGYHELTGTSADVIEVLNLDERGETKREQVNDALSMVCAIKSVRLAKRSARTTYLG